VAASVGLHGRCPVGLSVSWAASVTLLVAVSAGASNLPLKHVVVTDRGLVTLLAAGFERSATLRRLAFDLESSGWIVFVLTGPCPIREATGCLLHTVGRFEGRPYLRVKVTVRERHPDVVLVTVAHELQHALEVVSSGTVYDIASMSEGLRRSGNSSAKVRDGIVYETKAAREIEVQVGRELRRSSRQGTIGAPSPDRPPLDSR